MKEQLFITFLAHLLKQHENEELTLELSNRLVNASFIHAKEANLIFNNETHKPTKRKPYHT